MWKPWRFTPCEHAEASSGPRSNPKEFAALQQHIDELTQQKFELSRGLTAQQKMAQELAEENRNMAEDFNRQVTPELHIRSVSAVLCVDSTLTGWQGTGFPPCSAIVGWMLVVVACGTLS